MKKIISTTLIVFFFTTLAFTQNLSQTLRGTIIDTDSKLPLAGAEVMLLGSNPLIGVITDEDGRFRMEGVPVGRASIQTYYMGYEGKTMANIVVNSGKEVVLTIPMQESVVKMDEVVVMANKNKGEALNSMALLSARSISVDETNRFTGGMNDPARVVSSFAGVTFTQDGSSDIIVRGNSPKYMQWRLDGIEITSPYHMDDQNASFGALSSINNSLLSTSDFFTGAFSPEYGNVLSSVFDLKLRGGNNEKFEAAFGLGLLGTDITLEGPFKKGYAGSYLVNYRYSTVSLITDIGLVDIDGLVNFQDAMFKIVLPTKNTGIFSFFGLGGLSGFSMESFGAEEFTSPGKPKNADIMKAYDKDNFLGNLGMNHTLTINSSSYIKTSLSYSASGIDDDLYELDTVKTYNTYGEFVSDSIADKTQTFKSRILKSTYRAAVSYSNKINAKNKIQIGTKYALCDYDYNQSILYDEADGLFNVSDFKKNAGTINNFISWKHTINDKITLVSGLHNMNVLLNNKSTLEPRIAINWKISNRNSVFAGYGKHSTMESIHNYYAKVEQEDGSITEPNKDLDLLKADHYVVGYQKRFSENLMAKVEVYYQHLYNLPVENNDTSYYATINEGYDYRYVSLVNEGTGKNYGVELTLERFFAANYYFLINGSLFNSTYTSLEGIERNTQYNGNYLVNILCGKEFKDLGKKQNQILSLNAKVFFGGGKKYIPLLRDPQGNLAVDPANNRYWDYEKAYADKIDNVYQINISASYKFNRPNSTHEIFLDLMNLTNNEARIYEYYQESEPDKIGYLKQIFFFPNLMYRVNF